MNCVHLVQVEKNYVGVGVHKGGELTGLVIDCEVDETVVCVKHYK